MDLEEQMTESRLPGEGWVVVVTENRMKASDHGLRWLAGLLLGGLVLAAACSKEVTPNAEPQNSVERAPVTTSAAAVAARPDPAPEPQAAAAPAAASESAEGLAATNKVSEPNFDLSIEPKGDFKSGQAATVEIVLVAKAPFKVNDKYPYKFKVKEGAGLKYPGPVIKEGVKLEKMRAVLPVPVTPESAGKKQIAGRFDFSVCTPERCLIEKRELALAIDVK
jgi:hypothetical protein